MRTLNSLRMPEERRILRNERFKGVPERHKFVPMIHTQRQHGVVVGTRFLDMRQLRHEQTEVHGDFSERWLNAIRGKPADAEFERATRAARNGCSLSLGKGKVDRA
jgi:hypothetical protein